MIVLSIILLVLPVAVEFLGRILSLIDFPINVSMTTGEYSSYIGLCLTIVWAVYTFTTERRIRHSEQVEREKAERPVLSVSLIQPGLIKVRNSGGVPAINLTCCEEPIMNCLGPGKGIDLIWAESPKAADLALRYEDAVPVNDCIETGEGDLDIVLFAYSSRGKLWQYECILSLGSGSQITIFEG